MSGRCAVDKVAVFDIFIKEWWERNLPAWHKRRLRTRATSFPVPMPTRSCRPCLRGAYAYAYAVTCSVACLESWLSKINNMIKEITSLLCVSSCLSLQCPSSSLSSSTEGVNVASGWRKIGRKIFSSRRSNQFFPLVCRCSPGNVVAVCVCVCVCVCACLWWRKIRRGVCISKTCVCVCRVCVCVCVDIERERA